MSKERSPAEQAEAVASPSLEDAPASHAASGAFSGYSEYPAIRESLVLPGQVTRIELEFDEECAAVLAALEDELGVLIVIPPVRDDNLAPEIATLAQVDATDLLENPRVGTIRVRGIDRVHLDAVLRGPRYLTARIRALEGDGPPPDAAVLARLRRLTLRTMQCLGSSPVDGGITNLPAEEFLDRLPVAMRWDEDTKIAFLQAATLEARMVIAARRLIPKRSRTRHTETSVRTRRYRLDDIDERLEKAVLTPELRALAERLQEGRGDQDREVLQYILDIHWTREEPRELDLRVAREILDERHAGMAEVKDAVLDYLAVLEWIRRTGADPSAMASRTVCMVGPPGVGKTSIAQSIADATGRRLERFPLAGVDDVFLMGADRAYSRARPGEIARRLRASGRHSSGLVILLDEIDKVATERRSAIPALLALLDSSQNMAWQDQCLDELRLDLSGAIFIATANDETAISAPLKDRMQMLRIPAYSRDQQVAIGCDYLVPRLLKAHQVTTEVVVTAEAVAALVDDHPPAPGMRQLTTRLTQVVARAMRQHLLSGAPVVVDVAWTREWFPAAKVARLGFQPRR